MATLVPAASLSRPLVALVLLAGAVLVGTLTLWAYFGTAVFFEMVRAGWVACF